MSKGFEDRKFDGPKSSKIHHPQCIKFIADAGQGSMHSQVTFEAASTRTAKRKPHVACSWIEIPCYVPCLVPCFVSPTVISFISRHRQYSMLHLQLQAEWDDRQRPPGLCSASFLTPKEGIQNDSRIPSGNLSHRHSKIAIEIVFFP